MRAGGGGYGEEGGVRHTVMWNNGVITDLGALGILAISGASATNPAGVIVGNACAGPMNHAFQWEKGVMTELSALPPGGFDQRRGAAGINSQGEIVGDSEVPPVDQMNYHSVRWDKNGITDLGMLPGGTDSGANAINNQGLIVGVSWTDGSPAHAVLWTVK